MTAAVKIQCAVCNRTGTLEHNGQWFCKQHHPPTIRAKAEARYAKWRAEWDKEAAADLALKREEDSKMMDFLEGVPFNAGQDSCTVHLYHLQVGMTSYNGDTFRDCVRKAMAAKGEK